VLTDTGISEEELVHLLSPNESVPEGAPAGSYAPRH
jgi:hypothetical protein